MKRIQLLTFFILLLFLFACQKDNNSTLNPVIPIPIKGSLSFNNQFGVVEFNDEMQRWVINFGDHVMYIGAASRNCTAIPITDLPDQYKKQGTELLVAGAIDYIIDSISETTKQPVSRYILTYSNLKAAPGPDSLWTDYDYIKINIPGKVLFFSSNQLNMESFVSYTTVNLPDMKVYGTGSGFYYRQKESLSFTIFDSISRFKNNLPDIVKPGNLQYAIDAKSPGVSFSWSFPNMLYYSTWGDDNKRPDCYFTIVKSEPIPNVNVRTYRIGATFRCILAVNVNGSVTRIMGDGQLVTKINFSNN